MTVSANPREAMSTAVSRSSTSIAGSIERPATCARAASCRQGRIADAMRREREDQRHRGDVLDGRRLLDAAQAGAGVKQHLVATDRSNVERLVVDRQHDHAGLDAAGSDVFDNLGRVLADQPHADAGMAPPERLDHLGHEVVGGRAEDAERHAAREHLAHLGDGTAGIVDGAAGRGGRGRGAHDRPRSARACGRPGRTAQRRAPTRAAAPVPTPTAGRGAARRRPR